MVLALPDSKFTVFTHTPGYLEFRQNKRGFSPAVLELLAHLMHLNVPIAVQVQGALGENSSYYIPLNWGKQN